MTKPNARLIIYGQHQKAALPDTGIAPANTRGDDLSHTGVIVRATGGDHDPVVGMLLLEGPAILFHRFTGSENPAEDRLPCVRQVVADLLARATGLNKVFASNLRAQKTV